MQHPTEAELTRTLGALADPTRRAILNTLRRGRMRVTEVAEPFDLSLNAVSKHIAVLERAGLIEREVRGREHFLTLNPAPLDAAGAWIEETARFWSERLNNLERVLEKSRRRRRPRSKSS